MRLNVQPEAGSGWSRSIRGDVGARGLKVAGGKFVFELLCAPGVSAVRVCSEVIDRKLRALGVSAARVCSEVMDAMDAE